METPHIPFRSPLLGTNGGTSTTPGESAGQIIEKLKKQWFRLSASTSSFTCSSKHNSNNYKSSRKVLVEDAFKRYPKEVVMKFLAWAYARHRKHYAGKHIVFYNDEKMIVRPVKTRFNKTYLKSLVGKFWDLHQMNGGVLVTLTASNKKYHDPLEGIKELKKKWNQFRTALVELLGSELKFVTTIEPHKNGNYHMHVIFLNRTWLAKQSVLLKLWRGKAKGYGLHVERVSGASGLNYVLKYLRKALEDGDAGLLVFTGTRQYSTSKELVQERQNGSGKFKVLETERQSIYFLTTSGKRSMNCSIDASDARYANIMEAAKGFDPPLDYDPEKDADYEWEWETTIDANKEEGYLGEPMYWRWWLH